jgi:hypothetical protein
LAGADPAGARLSGTCQSKTGPSKTGPFKASPSKTGPFKASPSKTSSSKTGPSKASTAVVLDEPQPAAYCVPGRPAAIVLTSGALAVLDPGQLRAVLAHERAHLAGRHHLLIALTRGLAASFPAVPLFARGADEVARLAEMCADDAAARQSSRPVLITALLAMGTGTAVSALTLGGAAVGGTALGGPALGGTLLGGTALQGVALEGTALGGPALGRTLLGGTALQGVALEGTALGAAACAVAARVQRLLEPAPRARHARNRLALTAVIVALALVSGLVTRFAGPLAGSL